MLRVDCGNGHWEWTMRVDSENGLWKWTMTVDTEASLRAEKNGGAQHGHLCSLSWLCLGCGLHLLISRCFIIPQELMVSY